ncbi:MAG: DUF1189 family protein [Pseudomonadota bacterium]
MKRYNIFQPYLLSFYSQPLYRDVAQRWRGIGFFYLLVLLFLAWLPIMVAFHYDIKKIVNEKLPPIINQIPNISFQQGQTNIDQPSPVFIKEPGSQNNIAVIDTSGKYNNLSEANAYILLTKDKLYVRSEAGPRIYNVETFGDRKITRSDINTYAENFKNWAVTVFYPIVMFVSIIYRLLEALIIAAIGAIIFDAKLKTKLDFKSIFRLSVVAMTPAIIIATIVDFMNVSGRWLLIVYAVISLAYLYFAMQSNANNNVQTNQPPSVEKAM